VDRRGEPKMTDRTFGQLTRRLCDFSSSRAMFDKILRDETSRYPGCAADQVRPRHQSDNR
jgi:hypothetical protein